MLGIFIGVIFGGACAAIAAGKGRNAIGWFFFGFFFNIIALIVVIVVSDLTAEAKERKRNEMDKRRLREQLMQERMKNQTFQQHVTRRLDTHDQVLQIDTRTGSSLFEPAAQAIAAPEPVPVAQERPQPRNNKWYYEQEGETRGPISEAELQDKLFRSELSGDVSVWTENQDRWRQAREIDALRPYII